MKLNNSNTYEPIATFKLSKEKTPIAYENKVQELLEEKVCKTREEAEARLAAQLPVETKAEKSHYVIWNNASAEELRQKAQDLVVWLKSQV